MKYLKKYENRRDIHTICREFGIENYAINDDYSISVDGDVYLTRGGLKKLPLEFRLVSGSFNCYINDLTSLKGCPESVYHFSCSENKLTSLEGCPQLVSGHFVCADNYLKSLEWCPESIGISFYCDDNNLTTLQGCPKSVVGSFWCNNNNIETFEGLDFVYIGNNFYCHNNPICEVWDLFKDHTKFEFFNDCDPMRENRIIILDRLNFFLDYIDKPTVTKVEGYKCI